jgi:hypothetical protein
MRQINTEVNFARADIYIARVEQELIARRAELPHRLIYADNPPAALDVRSRNYVHNVPRPVPPTDTVIDPDRLTLPFSPRATPNTPYSRQVCNLATHFTTDRGYLREVTTVSQAARPPHGFGFTYNAAGEPFAEPLAMPPNVEVSPLPPGTRFHTDNQVIVQSNGVYAHQTMSTDVERFNNLQRALQSVRDMT